MSFGKPQRLEWIFKRYDPPLYFVTLCTAKRRKVLANEKAHSAFRNYAEVGEARGYAVGRYVIRGIWQRGFFDHLIWSDESYSEKWNYVQQNPVRAGLVRDADEWPFQGEIVAIEHS